MPRAFTLAVALLAAIVIVAGTATAFTSVPVEPNGASDRPNIVLILTDDQRWDTLKWLPSVRALAAHGVEFTNAFVTTSLCCPSRTSILTGQYSHTTGVYSNVPPDGGAPRFDDSSTLATWLHDGGYETALIGKYLNSYDLLPKGYIPPGWDEWDVIANLREALHYYDYKMNQNGSYVNYGGVPYDYTTAVLTELALRFLGSARAPFFLYFAPNAPHEPSLPAPGDHVPASALPPERPNFFEDTSDKPWNGINAELGLAGGQSTAASRARILASLLEVDRAVRAITDLLRARGTLDGTVIAFMSDNGFLWAEHRLHGKIWPYEESIRVPMVFRLPWQMPPGRIDDHLVLNIDIASTFSELAGVKPGLPQEGRSLMPLLRPGPDPPKWRTSFIIEFLSRYPTYGVSIAFEGIRTERYVYVRYDVGWRELYDLRKDPYELTNLAGSPGSAGLQARLGRKLDRLLAS